MNPDDLARILDELGQRLGPTGEYVFQLAVRNAVITSSMWLVLAGVAIGLALLIFVLSVVFALKHEYSDGPFYTGTIAVCMVVVALIVIGLSLPNYLNPEYAALRDILGAIR